MGARSRRAALARFRAADAALAANGRRERARGVSRETAEFRHLNQAVSDAARDLSWWRRHREDMTGE